LVPTAEYALIQNGPFKAERQSLAGWRVNDFQAETNEAYNIAHPRGGGEGGPVGNSKLPNAHWGPQLDRYKSLSDKIDQLHLTPEQRKTLTIGDIYQPKR